MATSPTRPIRLRILDQEGVANYPNELLSDFDNKKLALYDADHNKMIEFFADLSTEVSGSGNAITELTVSGNKITAVKTETFLTEHPGVDKGVDSTSTQNAKFGDTVTIVDSVVRDTNGHVTKINLKTVTLPTESEISVTSSGTGNAVTGMTASDHGITLVKDASFLTEHPTVTVLDDTISTATPAEGGTFDVVDSVTRDANGHVTKVNTKTVTLPTHQDTGVSKGTATGEGNAVTDITVEDGVITPVKGETFLTEHPSISTTKTPYTDRSLRFGGEFTVVTTVMRDSNGHVTDVYGEYATMPSETKLSVESSGEGNAVTSATVSDHKITLVKGGTFLTEHPAVETATDTTSTATPTEGGAFEVVDGVTRDTNGHVTKVNTKTVTLPTHKDPELVIAASTGDGNAITQLEVSGHTITPVKGFSFLTDHPDVDQSEDTTMADQKPGYGGCIPSVRGITRDMYGHIKKITFQDIYFPDAPTDVTGNAGTADKLKSPITVSVSGAVTGSATGVDGSSNVNIVATKIDATKIDGVIPIENIPQAALERLIPVADDAARLKLTVNDAQNGDVVKVTSTGLMYYVVDQTKLGTEAAFETFTAGTASAVDWSGITNKPTFAAVATSGSYNDLSDAPGVVVTSEGTGNAVTAIAQNGHGIKLTKGATFALSTHTHDTATTSAAGMMSAADKTKLEGIETGANKTVVDSALNADSTNPVQNKVVKAALDGKSDTGHTHSYAGSSSAGGAANSVKANLIVKLNGGTVEGTDVFTFNGSTAKSVNITPAAIGAATADHTHESLSTDVETIQTDLDNLYDNFDIYQNRVSSELEKKADVSHTHEYAGSDTAGGAANSVKSSLVIKICNGSDEGDNMFTFDGSEEKVLNLTPAKLDAAESMHNHDDRYYTETEVDSKLSGKSDTSHSHADATTTASGMMSAADKTKLDGVETGANKTVVDSALSSTSTNPVQNKAIQSALSGKSDTSHTHTLTALGAAASDHTHDDRYYTETEVDTKLASKSDTSHTHTLTALGAAASDHSHDDRYYTETEMDTKLSGKSDTSHSHSVATTTTDGMMSAADKTKLDGLESFTVDSAMSSTSTNPVQNKVVNSAIAGKATTAIYNATIGTSWSGSAAPYTQTITVSGITAADTPIVDVDLSGTDYSNKESVISAWSSVYRITTAANSITVYADDKTETAVPIQLKVVR